MKRTVGDVMTRTVAVVHEATPFKEIVERLAEYRVSALPVVDDEDRLVGIVSEADLLLKEEHAVSGRKARRLQGRRRKLEHRKAAGLRAKQVMTTPVHTVGPESTPTEAARTMHEAGVKRLPVVDAALKILGIVSRRDLLKVFLRSDAEIEREVRYDVIGKVLGLEPSVISAQVADGVVTLRGEVERRSLVPVVEGLVRGVEGVVGVEDHLTWREDDEGGRAEVQAPWLALGRAEVPAKQGGRV